MNLLNFLKVVMQMKLYQLLLIPLILLLGCTTLVLKCDKAEDDIMTQISSHSLLDINLTTDLHTNLHLLKDILPGL